MRIIIIALALSAAWYYFSASRSQFGYALVQNVENTAAGLWSAVPRPGKRAEEALQEERQRSASLETEMIALRDKVTRADAQAITREKDLADAQDALKAREAMEAAAVARAEALGAQIATTRQDAVRNLETLRREVADNEARSSVLRRDNVLLQDRLNGAAARSAADERTRAALQSDLRAAIEASQTQQEQARRLASDLQRLRETSASQIADLQGRLDDAKAEQAARAEATDTPPQAPPPEADGIGAAPRAAQDGAAPVVPGPLPTPPRDMLTEGIQTHVIVRFTADDPSAEARAVKLGSALQARGMLIDQIAAAPSRPKADSLSYFYKSDEIRAGLITTLFPEFRSSMRQRPPEDGIPRPGLIEIEVAT